MVIFALNELNTFLKEISGIHFLLHLQKHGANKMEVLVKRPASHRTMPPQREARHWFKYQICFYSGLPTTNTCVCRFVGLGILAFAADLNPIHSRYSIMLCCRRSRPIEILNRLHFNQTDNPITTTFTTQAFILYVFYPCVQFG